MANTYTKLPITIGSGGGSSDIPNESSAPGATISEALTNLDNSVDSVEALAESTQYVPQPDIVLTATDIANKYVLLNQSPTEPEKTRLSIVGGVYQDYGVDYEVIDGNKLSWESLSLDGDLEIGDTLVIVIN
jgi:hypothetical protein